MNLRSGAITLNFNAKAKPRRRQEIGEMEENTQKMLNELKSEITDQISDFRTYFQELQVEIKKTSMHYKTADAEERLNQVEERDEAMAAGSGGGGGAEALPSGERVIFKKCIKNIFAQFINSL